MARLKEEEWAVIRHEWENSLASFNRLADTHNVDRASVSRKAAKDGWQRNPQLTAINEAAQLKADSRVDSDGNAVAYQRRRSDIEPATQENAEDIRASVLVRHRMEWAVLEKHRQEVLKILEEAQQGRDMELWRIAKIAMDSINVSMKALGVKQAGESRVWGLDSLADNAEDFNQDNERDLDLLYQEGMEKISEMMKAKEGS